MQTRQPAFTIVELLIVIVVISILAAITVVAYNGIQSRAHDTAIKNDLRSLATQIKLYKAETGVPPATGGTNFPAILFKPTKASYFATGYNLYYCKDTTPGSYRYAIGAKSVSGAVYQYTSDSGLGDFTGTWSASVTNCPGMGISSYTFSYGKSGATWFSWTNG
ncbi:type II secretion system protein [Candidatus Saccharibacteria bacterium]|nr:type II secretion system protein [Candidatus Saccharibacteria bacterium]